MRVMAVASLLLTASAALAQIPGVVLEVTSTPAVSPSEQRGLAQCIRLYPPAGQRVASPMGDACSVRVRDGVAYFNVILESAIGNQFQVTIEPRSTAPEVRTITDIRRVYPVPESKPESVKPSVVPTPVTYSFAPSELLVHRRLHLDETLDIPVPDADSVVHVTFRWAPGSPNSAAEKAELVNAPSPLSGATRDWPAPQPELRFEKAKILFYDPVQENPRNIQYSLSNFVPHDDLHWVYLTGLGRFVFSLTPHPELGFQLAGEIQRDTVRVALGDLRFDVSSSRPLLDSSEAFRLYVRVEPGYTSPTTGRLPFIGSMSLEDLKPLNTR